MFTKDDIIVIPARKGSKGVPFKNRKLIQYTLEIIPNKYKDLVCITTDDEYIIEKYSKEYHVVKRDSKYAEDETSTKQTLKNLFNILNKKSGRCIMLYTVYPDRTWDLVSDVMEYYEKNKSKSLLCKKEYNGVHPYLMIYENGKQLVDHDLYRRQDYPKVFELSHLVTIFDVSELPNLNENIYNDKTIYFPLKNNIINIDNKEDIAQWEKLK